MTTLTDRYVAATLRSVAAARREEIAAELRASIEDMIEGRTAGGQDPATAEREVLTELGNPAELAARYTDRRLQLIGPTYYLAWQRLLTQLLSFVPATVGTVVGVIAAVDEKTTGGAVGQGITTAMQVALHICFWVTLVFAFLERTNAAQHLPKWTVDQLPKERVDRQITLADTAGAIAWIGLVIAYLPLQRYRSFVTDTDGGNLPVFDPALWSFWLPFLIAMLVANAGLELAKYRVGRWTWPLAAANAVLTLAVAVPVVWLLQTDRLLNPDLVARFDWLQQGSNLDAVTALAAGGTILVVLWEIGYGVVKAYRNRR